MNLKDIFIVLVLYKTSLEDSKTIQTLLSVLEDNTNLMVFDNSPISQYSSSKFQFYNFTVNYYHDGSNPGLSHAYNLALSKAGETNSKWLLLLDQDTTLTVEYAKEILSLQINEMSQNVVAIMPRVVSILGDKIIAPTKMSLGGLCRPISAASGIVKKRISGINSGTLLNVSFMNSIKGFSANYSLDMLDHWYFREIKNNEKDVYLLQSSIKQDLSIYGNFEENVSLTRYQQLLNAESHFIKEEGFLSLLLFKLRLVSRIIKQISYKNKEYYKVTVSEFFSFRKKTKQFC